MSTPQHAPSTPPLRLLEQLIAVAGVLNSPLGVVVPAKDNPEDAKQDMIDGLHGKGCATAAEILVLLRAGFADGALARWRSLYEVELIAHFIAGHGLSTAERYAEHAAIKNWEAINSISRHVSIDPATKAYFQRRRDEAVGKYGTVFKNEYGWAADVVGTSKPNGPNRGDLEKDIGREEWSPLYRAASYQVHPMANAVIGFMTASAQGMALPGVATVRSLANLSHVFIDNCVPEGQRSGVKERIDTLANEAGEAFASLP